MALAAAIAVISSTIGCAAQDLKNRTVMVFAADANDGYLRQQVELLAPAAEGLAERDVIVETFSGKDLASAAARRKFSVTGGFHLLLIGKDGHVAAAYNRPASPQQLFDIIDAMPMRQAEMRKAGSAKGRQ